MLSLLRPFVKTTASLKDATPPRLRNGATPQAVCRQSSEAIIFITSTYQTHYSLEQLPSLLPHMVYAAVLYQLTLATDPQSSCSEPHVSAESSAVGVSCATSSPRNRGMLTPQIPFAAQPAALQTPSSPTLDMEARRAARRRASMLSSVSALSSTSGRTSLSNSVQERRTPSSEANSGILPLFTSEPADLVTIGSLQLASMGASHPDAAEATRLLHTLSTARDLAGANYDLASLAESLPVSMDDFSASTLLTGLGLQRGLDLPPPPPDAEMFGTGAEISSSPAEIGQLPTQPHREAAAVET